MAGTTAQWKWHVAAVGTDFGKKMIAKVGMTEDEIRAKFGESTRGKYKGNIKAFIVWCKIIKGGWIKTGRNFYDNNDPQDRGELMAYNGYPIKAGSYCWHIVGAWPDVHGDQYFPKNWHDDQGRFVPDNKPRRTDLDSAPAKPAFMADIVAGKELSKQCAADKKAVFKQMAADYGLTQKRFKEILRLKKEWHELTGNQICSWATEEQKASRQERVASLAQVTACISPAQWSAFDTQFSCGIFNEYSIKSDSDIRISV